jgi:hypothetical protein
LAGSGTLQLDEPISPGYDSVLKKDITEFTIEIGGVSFNLLGAGSSVTALVFQNGLLEAITASASISPASLAITSTNAVYFDNVLPAGISSIDTITAQLQAAPPPAALPLFASGLGALGLLGWRRKRTARTVGV